MGVESYEECVEPAFGLGPRPVGLLLRGRPTDFSLVEVAARLTSERNLERGLMVILGQPYIPTQAVLQAGYSPERYALALDLEARTRAIEMFEEVDLRTKFSLFNVSRPALRRGARLAVQLGCEALLVSTRGRLRVGLHRADELRFGLPIVRVPREDDQADVASLPSPNQQED